MAGTANSRRSAPPSAALGLVLIGLSLGPAPVAHAQAPVVSEAVLTAPVAGETSAVVVATLRNPSMYDVFVVSVSSSVAGAARFERPGADGQPETVQEVPIAAYGTASLSADGLRIRLLNLTRPLAPGDEVALSFTTDAGDAFRGTATVRAR